MSLKEQITALSGDLKKSIAESDKINQRFVDDPDYKTEKTLAEFDAAVERGIGIKNELDKLVALKAQHDFLDQPASEPKSGGGVPAPAATQPRTVGESIVDSDDFKKIRKHWLEKGRRKGVEFSVEMPSAFQQKATFTQATATVTGYHRPSGVVTLGQQMPMIQDLFAQGETNQPTIRFTKEDTYTNAAAARAEDAAVAEATFDTSEVDSAVRSIGVLGRMSEELISDFPMLRDYVNERLLFMADQRVDTQVFSGSGTPPAIQGVEGTSGVQTQALSTNAHETILKGITKVRSTGFFEPDNIVLPPATWEALRLAKDDSNQYYGGGPFTGAYGQGVLAGFSLWGVPVVVSSFATADHALVGAYRLGAQLFRNGGVRVDISNSDASDFAEMRVAVRVTQRIALAVYRPTAFCDCTLA